MNNSNWTLRFPRTTRCDGHAIYYYRQPLLKRFFYGCIRRGWLLVPVVLAVIVLAGCVDMASEENTAASLRDAVAQARSESWAIYQR
jgi:hypothetical protein